MWLEWAALGGLIVCLAGSVFFALAESALFSLGRWRAQQLAEDDQARGGKVLQLLQNPRDLLGTIVLGNTLCNAGVVAIVLGLGWSGGWVAGLAASSAWLLVLVAGEVLPKTAGSRAPEYWAVRVVSLVARLKKLTGPLHRLAQRISLAVFRGIVPSSWGPEAPVTGDEFPELLEMACQQGGLGRAERDLIQQIIRLDRRTAQDVMKPRAQMACISDDLPVEEMILAARKLKHRRLPIHDEKLDTIVGMLNTRALLLDPQADLSEAVEFPSFVPESMNLLQLFRSFQRQRRGIGIVLDEYGGTAGLVTTEDILEEVVGEIYGEAETEGFSVEKLGEGRWRANGTTRIETFRPEYPEIGEVNGVDTLGGLIVTQLGVVPAQGESVVFRGLRLTALLADERRVREVLVETMKKRGGT